MVFLIQVTLLYLKSRHREREERVDLLALWTDVLTLRTVRLTDKSNQSVSVFQFLRLDLESDLKKKVKDFDKNYRR